MLFQNVRRSNKIGSFDPAYLGRHREVAHVALPTLKYEYGEQFAELAKLLEPKWIDYLLVGLPAVLIVILLFSCL